MIKYLVLSCVCFLHVLSSVEPVIVLIGPPGSGKGTFSQHLKGTYGYGHISAGDLVREEIDKQTPIGCAIAEIVLRGDYIDTAIMHKLMEMKIDEVSQTAKPFIIDGFIRTKEDTDFLYQLLADYDLLSKVLIVYLEAMDVDCKFRIEGRQVCPDCKYVYNVTSVQPMTPNQCDHCQSRLKNRINDTSEVIEKRIFDYRTSIQKNYASALSLFPWIQFNTSRTLKECLHSYEILADSLEQFDGETAAFQLDFTRFNDNISEKERYSS